MRPPRRPPMIFVMRRPVWIFARFASVPQDRHDAMRRHVTLSGRWPVDLIGAAFEGCGKTAEGGFEHGAHEKPERAAAKLVSDKKLDVAGILPGGTKGPAVVHFA